MRAYIQKFALLMVELPEMDEGDRLDKFMRGLKPYIRKEIELKLPSNLQEAMELSERIESSLYGLRRPLFNQSNPTPEPTPMEIDAMEGPSNYWEVNTTQQRREKKEKWRQVKGKGSSGKAVGQGRLGLTNAEYERLQREGRCFRCRQLGHRICDCPLRQGK